MKIINLSTVNMVIHIKDIDDLKTRLNEAGEKLVVIDFMATWCGPCKMIGPKLEEMASEMADSIVVVKVIYKLLAYARSFACVKFELTSSSSSSSPNPTKWGRHNMLSSSILFYQSSSPCIKKG
jgi:thiol-disulfide isomerase/thioredoxin